MNKWAALIASNLSTFCVLPSQPDNINKQTEGSVNVLGK